MHRHIEVGRPKISGSATFAVPGMGQLVSQQVTSRSIFLPLCKVSWPVDILARAMVLETDAAEILAEREQKIIMVERARPVKRIRFFHQFAIRRKLLRLYLEPGRLIGDYIGIHGDVRAGIEINTLVITAREQRRVDQRIE